MNTIRLSFVARPWLTGGLLLVWSVTVSSLFATTAQAEWYVGGYGGLSAPGGFSNVTATSATLGGGVTNADLNDLDSSRVSLGVSRGAIFLSRVRGWD